MKCCYLGCHSVLEYDELKMFTQIPGLEWFSTGRYFNPEEDYKDRPPLNFPVDRKHYTAWSIAKGKWNNKDFLDRFDVLYFMHRPDDVFDNWDLLKNRKIVWRTIGQNTSDIELRLQQLRADNPNLKIVRYSPGERRHKNYAGEDALIRFSKDSKVYGQWKGGIRKVLNVSQSMRDRGDACGWDIFSQIAEKVPCQLVGNGNQSAGDLWVGRSFLYEELLQAYRDYAAYLYTGTKPASYCLNFIEAWMTGIPVVALGPALANGPEDLYEVNQLLSYGKDGYWSDYPDDIVRICTMLLEQPEVAKKIGEAGRARAIELFDETVIQPQWAEFFKTL